MVEPEVKRTLRSRRWLIAMLSLLLIVGCGAIVLRHFMQPEKLTALLIDKTRDVLGTDLAIRGVASLSFTPNLHLVLPHPALRAHGASAAFLDAESLDVVAPWRTLWADRYDIERIDLVKPMLDLDAFSAWFAARPPSTGAPPDVRFSLRVTDATIASDGKPIAQGVNMTFASAGDLAAWLAKMDTKSGSTLLIPPLNGTAAASSIQFGATHLDDVRVDIRDEDAPAKPSASAQQ